MPTIVDNQTLENEIVLSERVVTTEFRVVEIYESIQDRFVRAEIELGPFITEERPGGELETRGSSRRGVVVWEKESYDAVRDVWRNEDLLTRISQLMG
jgi:hypothetical protein